MTPFLLIAHSTFSEIAFNEACIPLFSGAIDHIICLQAKQLLSFVRSISIGRYSSMKLILLEI